MLAEQTAAPRTDCVLSPFAFVARRLVEQGYSPLPIMPNGKMPGAYVDGVWRPMSGWTEYCDRPPTSKEIETWEAWPGGGVGIALGSGLIAVDIDRDDLVEPICAALPGNAVGKIGKKGLTLFFQGRHVEGPLSPLRDQRQDRA